jgi:hypothetical protein
MPRRSTNHPTGMETRVLIALPLAGKAHQEVAGCSACHTYSIVVFLPAYEPEDPLGRCLLRCLALGLHYALLGT